MPVYSIAQPPTFREATEDLVSTIRGAVQQNELSQKDREWLIGELDELIEGLKIAKVNLAKKEGVVGHKKTGRNGFRHPHEA